MVIAYGICAALVERATSGQGQVVDTAIVDGVASLLAMPLMLMAQGLWRDERGVNLLDGGVPGMTCTRPPTASGWPSAPWSPPCRYRGFPQI